MDPNFQIKTKDGLTRATNLDEFYKNLEFIIKDPDLIKTETAFCARQFLITSLARNLAVHSYPDSNRFFGEIFKEIIDASVFSILLSWKIAKSNNWI